MEDSIQARGLRGAAGASDNARTVHPGWQGQAVAVDEVSGRGGLSVARVSILALNLEIQFRARFLGAMSTTNLTLLEHPRRTATNDYPHRFMGLRPAHFPTSPSCCAFVQT